MRHSFDNVSHYLGIVSLEVFHCIFNVEPFMFENIRSKNILDLVNNLLFTLLRDNLFKFIKQLFLGVGSQPLDRKIREINTSFIFLHNFVWWFLILSNKLLALCFSSPALKVRLKLALMKAWKLIMIRYIWILRIFS